jgi:hypothetical protein
LRAFVTKSRAYGTAEQFDVAVDRLLDEIG